MSESERHDISVVLRVEPYSLRLKLHEAERRGQLSVSLAEDQLHKDVKDVQDHALSKSKTEPD